MNKIKTLVELGQVVQALKAQGEVIVQCHGVFDLMHPGHYKHFESAKKLGDVLAVTITPDHYVKKGLGRPLFNQRLRAETIAKNEDVDYVAINEYPTAVEAIRLIQPNIYVKGMDYEEDDITGEIVREKATIESIGGKIHFTNEVAFSSTSIINRYFNVYPEEAHEFLEQFSKRYKAEDIINALKSVSVMRVLIVGDAIIDQYCYCKSLNKSPKENIIPAQFVSEESFAGGSLAVTNHVASFCDQVYLVTCLGNSYANFIASYLKPNIVPKFFNSGQTIVKRRFVEPTYLTKLFEVCYLHDGPPQENSEIADYLLRSVGEYDLVIIVDFGHGLISRKIIDVICKEAKFLAVSAQTNSANVGFNLITKYPRADYICLDDPEIRLACHNRYDDIEVLVLDLADKMNCERIVVTHGKYGTVSYDKRAGFFKTPILSSNVLDTMGAGDAFLSITSPLVASGAPMDLVGFVGQVAGALQCQVVGNREALEPIPLFKFITALLK